ncbi:NAD(P)-binding domain-containing protein [Streptomyces sp. NPDC050738]|uniref:NADPH-dependent F420 reductase n=1 Tax=Streptomyces sp. NPDC050738 TaxID=3154744 RepID=UPI003417EDD2
MTATRRKQESVMQISIIGSGSIGGTLARQLVGAGHAVTIANSRGPASLAQLAQATGATAAETTEAIVRAELLIVSVPMGALPELGRTIEKHLPAGAVIVDTSNYVPEMRDVHIAAIDDGLPESLWVAQQLNRPIIKALNTIGATSLAAGGQPHGDARRIAAPVSGADAAAKRTVIALLDEIGFDGFDAGDLENSWRQQPGTPVYTTDLTLHQARKAIAEAERGDTTAWREHITAKRQ